MTSDNNPVLLPSVPGESARQYEAFSFWLQSGKVNARVVKHFGVNKGTVDNWKRRFNWEQRAMELEQKRAVQVYSKEHEVNELMGKIAVGASELVTRSGVEDYEAMVAVWRRTMTEMAEKDGGMTARDLRDMISARDMIDQIGRRIARLPVVYKQQVSSYGQGGQPLNNEEETITWT